MWVSSLQVCLVLLQADGSAMSSEAVNSLRKLLEQEKVGGSDIQQWWSPLHVFTSPPWG